MVARKHVDKVNYLVETLCSVLVKSFKAEFSELYDAVKNRSPPAFVIRNFQSELENAPKRTELESKAFMGKIVEKNDCVWLENHIAATFDEFRAIIDHRGSFDLPAWQFLNMCYINIARNLWKKPYLLFGGFKQIDCSKNLSDFDDIIRYAIVSTLSESVPIETLQQARDVCNDDVISVLGDDVSISEHDRIDDCRDKAFGQDDCRSLDGSDCGENAHDWGIGRHSASFGKAPIRTQGVHDEDATERHGTSFGKAPIRTQGTSITDDCQQLDDCFSDSFSIVESDSTDGASVISFVESFDSEIHCQNGGSPTLM